jgi:hypothetical protein
LHRCGTIDTLEYTDPGAALTDLRNGKVNGVLTIPPEFSRRVLEQAEPKVALIEDNTDNFVSAALAATLSSMLPLQPAGEGVAHPGPGDPRRRRGLSCVPYQCPVARLGRDVDLHDGDDRRRHHLHRRQEPRAARRLSRHADHEIRADCRFNISGTVKAVLAGAFLMTIGSVIAGIPTRSMPCGCSGCSWSSS